MSRSKAARPTLSDVAKKSGVSQATASVVMNNSSRVHISEDTRKRVLDAAKSLGYQPRRRKSAVAPKPKRIAYFVHSIDQDISISSLNGVREAAWQNDYMVYIISYGCDPAAPKAL